MTRGSCPSPSQERFTLGLDVYDVSEAKRILDTEGAAETRKVRVADLSALFTFIAVDPDAALALPQEALSTPVIGAFYEGNVLMIDGYHRTYAARERGQEEITMQVLGEEQTDRIHHRRA